MDRFYGFGLNRTMCDVLKEMRSVNESAERTPVLMLSLIEEMQIMGNRMEAGLHMQKDIKDAHKYIKDIKAEIKSLEARKDVLDESNKSIKD